MSWAMRFRSCDRARSAAITTSSACWRMERPSTHGSTTISPRSSSPALHTSPAITPSGTFSAAPTPNTTSAGAGRGIRRPASRLTTNMAPATAALHNGTESAMASAVATLVTALTHSEITGYLATSARAATGASRAPAHTHAGRSA